MFLFFLTTTITKTYKNYLLEQVCNKSNDLQGSRIESWASPGVINFECQTAMGDVEMTAQ